MFILLAVGLGLLIWLFLALNLLVSILRLIALFLIPPGLWVTLVVLAAVVAFNL